MYIFGGRSDLHGAFHSSRDYYSDILKVLNLKTGRWEDPKVGGDCPCGRRSHSACKFFFFLKVHFQHLIWSTKLFQRSFTIISWIFITDCKVSLELKVYLQIPFTQRVFDLNISNFSLFCWFELWWYISGVHNKKMYIFGGYLGTENRHLNELHEFDPATSCWRRLKPFGIGPSPRRRQCAVIVGERVFLFGGTM